MGIFCFMGVGFFWVFRKKKSMYFFVFVFALDCCGWKRDDIPEECGWRSS